MDPDAIDGSPATPSCPVCHAIDPRVAWVTATVFVFRARPRTDMRFECERNRGRYVPPSTDPRPPASSMEKSWPSCGRFLRFPIGDRRGNRTRASVSNAAANARPSLTNATLTASRLLHRRSPTARCSKGALAAHRKKLAAFSALGGDCGSQRGPARS